MKMCKGTVVYYGNLDLPDRSAAANRVSANAKILRCLGYKVVFIGVDKTSDYFEGVRVSDFDENTYLEAYPDTSKRWFLHIFDINNIKSVVSKYDDVKFIFLYNVPYETLKRVKKAYKKTSIKVVYDCTEWNSFAQGNFIKRYYKKYDAAKIEKNASKISDAMIVISKMMYNRYIKDSEKLLLLPPLVDLSDEMWNQSRKEHEGFEFCFAGSPGNKECMQEILSAFDLLKHDKKRLRIIGLNEEEFVSLYPESEKILSENEERLDFMGYLSHKETVLYILSCDCYIFIRNSNKRNEAGFPTKFAEGFTCGVPIITTDVSDIKEYADSRCTVIDSVDVGLISEAMKEKITDGVSDFSLKHDFSYENFISEFEKWFELI